MENPKTFVTIPSSSPPLCSSFSNPHLKTFTTKHNVNMIKVKADYSAESNYNNKFRRLNVPLKLKSKVGKFLSGILHDVMMHDNPQKFYPVVIDDLKLLNDRRDSAIKQILITDSDSSVEHMFQRRIAELVQEKCRIAMQDVMYLLIIFQFNVYDVSLVPKISKCLCNGRLESLPDMERKLKYIHNWELWEAIMEILNMLTFVNTINIEAESSRMIIITKDWFAKMYVACILYGYFLKSVSLRYQLEKCLFSSYDDLHIDHGISHSALRKLKDYVKGFKRPKLVLDGCELRSKEALQLVESHTRALFEHNNEYGSIEFDDDDMFIEASFSSIKRLLWEGLAFGSFLWMAEDFIDRIYKLEDLEAK